MMYATKVQNLNVKFFVSYATKMAKYDKFYSFRICVIHYN
jgi:hypothetical protein